MHRRGYVHRDLKLENLLYDKQQLKIIDFGFAERINRIDNYCGTPHYMAPEIVKKTPYNPQAADVWAAGVILYLIFVGKLPFFGEFEADLFRKIQNAKYPPVP